MEVTLSLEHIIDCIASVFDSQQDGRNQERCQYLMSDAGLAAFSVFYTQSPSFLSYQRDMAKRKGKSNAQTVFSLERIPTDTHIRTMLDGIESDALHVVYRHVFKSLRDKQKLTDFEVSYGHKAYYLLAMDGTEFHSSEKVCCEYCCQTHKDGKVRYHHSMIPPVLVHPEQAEVICLEPEFITRHEDADATSSKGDQKQDCETRAMKRWLKDKAPHYDLDNSIVLCDDLHCHQPQAQAVLDRGWDFIFVCKPSSHKTLYDYLALAPVETLSFKHWNGRFYEVHHYRFAQDLPLRDSHDSLRVDWCELTIHREDNKQQLFKASFATSLTITQDTVQDIVCWGRSRWKTENEGNNTLKTKGYHLEHNFGHGKHGLANVLVSLLLLAFLTHTLFALFDPKYQAIRTSFGSRRDFFNNLRSLLIFNLFSSWSQLLNFIIDTLDITFDSS